FWQGALFDEHYADVNANFRPTGNLQLGGYVRVGTMIDLDAARTGRSTMYELWGNANIGRGIAVDWDLIRQEMRRDGGTAFEALVLNTGGSWQFTPRQRLRLVVQGSDVERDVALYEEPIEGHARDWAAQAVYSYKVNPRTVVYAGASYGAFRDDENPDLFGNTRSVFLTPGYGWQPGAGPGRHWHARWRWRCRRWPRHRRRWTSPRSTATWSASRPACWCSAPSTCAGCRRASTGRRWTGCSTGSQR